MEKVPGDVGALVAVCDNLGNLGNLKFNNSIDSSNSGNSIDAGNNNNTVTNVLYYFRTILLG